MGGKLLGLWPTLAFNCRLARVVSGKWKLAPLIGLWNAVTNEPAEEGYFVYISSSSKQAKFSLFACKDNQDFDGILQIVGPKGCSVIKIRKILNPIRALRVNMITVFTQKRTAFAEFSSSWHASIVESHYWNCEFSFTVFNFQYSARVFRNLATMIVAVKRIGVFMAN